MPTATTYTKKQLKAIMERYTRDRLAAHSFDDLPLKFKFEVSQYGSSVSCHLRTTEGVLMKVDELVDWFDALPKAKQTEILEVPKAVFRRG